MDTGEEFIVFRHDHARDPDGSKFRGLVTAHLAFERARASRGLLVQVLFVVTVALALQLGAGVACPRWLEVLVWAAWASTLVALAVTSLSESRWRAERARLLAELPPPPQ